MRWPGWRLANIGACRCARSMARNTTILTALEPNRLPTARPDEPIRKAAIDVTSSGSEVDRSEEHTSELQSLMRISYAVFCLKKKTKNKTTTERINMNNNNKCIY